MLVNLIATHPGFTEKAADDMFATITCLLPFDNCLPASLYQAKNLTKRLGLDFRNIDGYPSGCMLFDLSRQGNRDRHRENKENPQNESYRLRGRKRKRGRSDYGDASNDKQGTTSTSQRPSTSAQQRNRAKTSRASRKSIPDPSKKHGIKRASIFYVPY
ncbi:hypothetical protein KC19_VG290500 [Ceratodon purpureus]|uniref:Uncharacterized protein n=1 Tax=Ceratodon purpureus TaxID=3225 RepID=A0A8T0HVN1_CERPU|nr:hypothetical protein KC19_VG290500 [Ceratodon purpureus]